MSESRDEVLSRLGRKLAGLDKRQSESQAARMRAERFEELIEAELKLCEAQIAFVRDGGELVGVDDEGEPIATVDDEGQRDDVIVPSHNPGVVLGIATERIEKGDAITIQNGKVSRAEDYMIPDVETHGGVGGADDPLVVEHYVRDGKTYDF